MMKKNVIISIGVFIAAFSFFFLKNHYYLPSVVEIRGSGDNISDAFLWWDSGKGFSKFERVSVFTIGRYGRNTYQVDGRHFRATVPLPQLRIDSVMMESRADLELESMKVTSAKGDVNIPLPKAGIPPHRDRKTVLVEGVNLNTVRLHPVLLAVQLLLALCSACLTYCFLGLRSRLNQPNWSSTFIYIFVREKHWIFWLMFVVSSSVYFTWLLGQWPGKTNLDAIWNWEQSIFLEFLNWQPFLYSFYILVLRQFLDSPAVVALFQIAATSALGSYIFYFVVKNGGIRFIYIAPFFIAFAFSIPVGLFTITMLKGVLFAILLLFWAFSLYFMAYNKKVGRPLKISYKGIMLLSALLALLCMVRHTAIIYLVFLPVVFLLGKLMSRKRIVQFTVASIAIFSAFEYGLGHSLGVHKKVDYHFETLVAYAGPLLSLFASDYYYSDTYEKDKQIIEKWLTLEEIQKVYYPTEIRFWSTWADDEVGGFSYRQGLTTEEKEAIFRLYLRRALDNLPIIMENRVAGFFNALGFKGLILGGNVIPSRAYGYRDPSYKNTQAYCPVFAPKSKRLNKYQNKLVKKTFEYKGILRGRFIYWNLFFPLVLLIIVFLLYKWLPLSALFSSILLIEVLVVFVTLTTPEYRYIYFLHLCGFFIVPLVILELATRAGKKKSGL